MLVQATRAATHAVVHDELVQVKFAAPPPAPVAEPPPPQAAPPAVDKPRPKAKRRSLKAPDELPEHKPAESDEPLAAAEQAGPSDGFRDGVQGGTGSAAPTPPPPPPPAPPKPEPLVPPVAMKSNAAPPYSASARRKEVEGTVVVSFEVLENGSVGHVQVLSGPEELRENVVKAVATWRFEPARRGGRPVRTRQTKSILFRLSGT